MPSHIRIVTACSPLRAVGALQFACTLKKVCEARAPSQRTSTSTRLSRSTPFVQRDGVPYEVEQTVCTICRRVLSERELKRAAA